jgi:hypothetical protein
MLLRISDATLLTDLCAHLLRSGFDVEEAGGTIGVRDRDDPSYELELQEIELHLRAWRASHPGVKVERVGRRDFADPPS